ncbi:MAG: hypothetical protein ACYS7Y_30375 [Planctomycetota bacterium]
METTYAFFLANSPLMLNGGYKSPRVRSVKAELERLSSRVDPVPTADFKERDTVYQMTEGLTALDVCKLVFTFFKTGNVYETATVSWQGQTRDFEAGIKTAFGAEVPGWQDSHFTLAGGLISNPLLSLTLDGTSVAKKPWAKMEIVRTSPSPVYYYGLDTTYGQPNRPAWAMLHSFGLVDEPYIYGEPLPGDYQFISSPEDNPKWPGASMRSVIAEQAGIDDANPELVTQLKTLLRVQ